MCIWHTPFVCRLRFVPQHVYPSFLLLTSLKPRPERWRDMGLGGNYGEILKACTDLQSKDVLAWTWVVSPAPDLMALVREDQRRDLVRALTETIVTEYYEARGLDLPRYSYVL